MLTFTQDQWIIVGLVFLLGILIGVFMTAGGRRKWKTRYKDEATRRDTLEREHRQALDEWTKRDAEREAALSKSQAALVAATSVPTAAGAVAARRSDTRDVNNDGVVTPAEKKSTFVDRMLGRDRDGDGVPDSADVRVDRNADGVDDRSAGDGTVTTRLGDADGDGVANKDDRRPVDDTRA